MRFLKAYSQSPRRWLDKVQAVKVITVLLAAVFLSTTNLFAQTFTRVTDAGNPLVTEAGGLACAWGDYDNDGLQDAFITPNFLYHNEGGGNFTRMTSGPIANASGVAAGASWADYDNDGWLDLFVVYSDTQSNVLYRNLGNGNFMQLTHLVITQDGGNSQCASWADYDRDGWLDLFVARGGGALNLLYHNEGNGGFTKITTRVMATEGGASRSSNWVDYDNDGDLDLFVANFNAPNYLYRNEDGSSFTKINNPTITSESLETASSSWADYDNDGDWDLLLTTDGGQNDALYRNDGNGSFAKITATPVANDSLYSTSASWGDFDNDGDEDLFVANLFGTGDRLYQNNGRGNFIRLVNHVIESKPFVNSHGSSWEDYDNDGDVDLFVTTQTSGSDRLLYHNEGTSNNWVKIKCVGTSSNAAAIGAIVKVKVSINGQPVWQMRQLTTQTSFRSQNSLLSEFGLGDAASIDSIRVTWPSGQIADLTNEAVNRTLSITEEVSGILIRPLPDTTTSVDGPILRLALDDYFDNASGNLSYSASASDSSKLFVQVQFSGNVLKVTPLAVGSAKVVVEAFDFITESSTSDTFQVTVTNAGQPPALTKVYWTDRSRSSIQRANADGAELETLVAALLNNPLDLALDFSAGKMYWSENFASTTPKIQRANLDGSGQEAIIDFSGLLIVPSIALDIPNQKIYWAANPTANNNNSAQRSPGAIQRASFDGSNLETINTTVVFPVGIAVGGGKVYWYDDATGLIERANVNGDSIESIIEQPSQQNAPLAVDISEGKIYWIADGYLRRANLDGTNDEDLLDQTGLANDLTLDLVHRKVYWSNNAAILRANFDGSHLETLPFLNLAAVYGLGVDGSNRPPEQFAFPFPRLAFRRGDPPSGIDLKSYFRDLDGDSLLFAVSSSDTNVASMRVSRSLLIITPKDAGITQLSLIVKDLRGGALALTDSIVVSSNNQPPAVTNPIPDQTLPITLPQLVFNLDSTFADPNNDALAYSAFSSDAKIVSVAIDGPLFVRPVALGKAMVIVTASDSFGETAADSFFVNVVPAGNLPPAVRNAIPPVTLVQADSAFRLLIELTNVFIDPDEDFLTYEAVSSNPVIAQATVSGVLLNVRTGTVLGTTSISVTADDGRGGRADTVFQVTIVKEVTPPVLAPESLPNLALGINSGVYEKDLNAVFTDADPLTFTAASSAATIATAAIAGTSILQITPRDTGTAVITVTANDGKAGVTTASFQVRIYASAPPVISLVASEPGPTPMVNVPYTIRAVISDDQGPLAIRLAAIGARRSDQSTFATLPVDTQIVNQVFFVTAIIPADLMVDTGVEFFVAATDTHGVPARLPASGGSSLRVRVGGTGVSKNLEVAGAEQTSYRLFAVPLDLDDKNPQAVLADDLGAYDDKSWRFYDWVTDAGGNVTKAEFPATAEMALGKAFWLIVRSSGKVIDSGPGITANTAGRFKIALRSGWNLAGNPFNFSAQAEPVSRNGNILELYRYTGQWQGPLAPNDLQNENTRLKSFEGYAVFSAAPDTMFITPVRTGAGSAKTNGISVPQALWSIRILAECQYARDDDNWIAVREGASRAWDENDHPEPPGVGEYVSVYFPHAEWPRLSKTYCTDFRPALNESEEWDFAVETNIRDEVRLAFEDIASVPNEYEVWLIDKALQIAQDLRRNNHYSVAGRGPENPKQLTLVVSRAGKMKDEYEELQAAPASFELSQNFPNPFNPATTIRFALPKPERVTLQVFNLLGELIATLVDNESKDAGYHVAIWNGRNAAGRPVGNGVYFIRMRAGEFVKVRKVVLVE